MSSKLRLQLAYTSRHKKTALYSKKGKVFFGIWDSPEIPLDGTEKVITIEPEQEGQLDLIAKAEYGDRALWWVIAKANSIANVTDEVIAGKVITIPNPDFVHALLLENKDATGF